MLIFEDWLSYKLCNFYLIKGEIISVTNYSLSGEFYTGKDIQRTFNNNKLIVSLFYRKTYTQAQQFILLFEAENKNIARVVFVLFLLVL